MTSSARDVRYGRRGGRWLEERTGSDVCDTCRAGSVRYRASRQRESWLVCTGCRDQGLRLGAAVTYEPLSPEVLLADPVLDELAAGADRQEALL